MINMLNLPAWQREGLCITGTAGLLDAFFPGPGEPLNKAREICARCPVANECAEYAIVNNEKFGVWGGTSEAERRKERARRRAAGTIVEPPQPIRHGADLKHAARCVRRPEGPCVLCRDVRARHHTPDPKPQPGYPELYVRTRKRLADIDGAA